MCSATCVAGTPGGEPGAFSLPTFVAVDNSGGESDGDVYVADLTNNVITKFTSAGTLVTTWGTGGQLDGSTATEGPFGEIAGIAIDSSGTLNVFNVSTKMFQFNQAGAFQKEFPTARGTAPNGLAVDASQNFYKANGAPSIEKFTSDGTDLGQVSFSETATGIAVDSSTGELYVASPDRVENFTFEPSGEILGTGCIPGPGEGCQPTYTFGTNGILSAAAGIGADGTSHKVYVADSGTSQIKLFIPAKLPQLTTEPPSDVGRQV